MQATVGWRGMFQKVVFGLFLDFGFVFVCCFWFCFLVFEAVGHTKGIMQKTLGKRKKLTKTCGL